jgi:dTMP kinase
VFIVLEGIDGCGKSTHAKLLADWLKDGGRDVLLTSEPTDGKVGRLVREILSGRAEVDPRTLALLFTADRVEHVREIREAQDAGKAVISDRYYYSTVAYQAAQGVDRKWLMELNRFAPAPDVVVLLDVEAAAGAARAKSGEIFERKEFLDKVRVEYRKFRTMKVVDSSRPQTDVQGDIRSLVAGRI